MRGAKTESDASLTTRGHIWDGRYEDSDHDFRLRVWLGMKMLQARLDDVGGGGGWSSFHWRGRQPQFSGGPPK